MTDRGFHLTWRVGLTLTKALPETQETTQEMTATTTNYRVRTTSKKINIHTTALQQKTTTPTSPQVSSTAQAKITSTPKTTELTTEDTNTYKYISSTRSTTLVPVRESLSTVVFSGRTTSPPVPSELHVPSSLFVQYSEKKWTTRSFSFELTTLDFNATSQKEDKNTFDIQTG